MDVFDLKSDRLAASSLARPVSLEPMSELRISQGIFDAIRAHGEETYPHECCGVLLGRSTPNGWRVDNAVRADNRRTDSAHNRYMIAPLELVKIQRQAH